MVGKTRRERARALAAAKKAAPKRVLALLLPFLDAKDARIRVRAAGALADLGDGDAVTYLVKRIEARGGGGPRVHTFAGTQLSYVKDFDVELS